MKYLNYFLIINLIVLIFFIAKGYSLNECSYNIHALNKFKMMRNMNDSFRSPFEFFHLFMNKLKEFNDFFFHS